jgi:hypothetical protein
MRQRVTDNPNYTGKKKLTLEQVIACLTELKNVSGRELSRRWGVSHACVNDVRNGKSWQSHIELLGLPKWEKTNKND